MLLTDLVEQAVGERCCRRCPCSTRSHLLLVGAVQDPEVRAWADGAARPTPTAPTGRRRPPGRCERGRRAAARLRAAGATVVDAPPGGWPRELGDAYLEMKAAGRL